MPGTCALPTTPTTTGPLARASASASRWSRSCTRMRRIVAGNGASASGSMRESRSIAQRSVSLSPSSMTSRLQNLRSTRHTTPSTASASDARWASARDARSVLISTEASTGAGGEGTSPRTAAAGPPFASALACAAAASARQRSSVRARSIACCAEWSYARRCTSTRSSRRGTRRRMRPVVTLAARSASTTFAPTSSAACSACANSSPVLRCRSVSNDEYITLMSSVQSRMTAPKAALGECEDSAAGSIAASLSTGGRRWSMPRRSSHSSTMTVCGRSARIMSPVSRAASSERWQVPMR
mmetsp:Transcript_1467/g.3770  ORF Transcript_1467/g.3770 Transcript_1467/m.3770 type:complete len:299 (-) Transcript_1467:130-1026(-)